MSSLLRSWFWGSDRDREPNREEKKQKNKSSDMENSESCKMRAMENQSSDIENSKSCEMRVMEQELNGEEHNQNNESSWRKGVITTLGETWGAIDSHFWFDSKAAGDIFYKLTIGCKVEFLRIQKSGGDMPIVVIVHLISELATIDETQEALEKLTIEESTISSTQTRDVIGVISIRKSNAIEVNTECGKFKIELDTVKIAFKPNGGDRVRLICNILMDKQDEIYQVTQVLPQNIEYNQMCVVERVGKTVSMLSKSTYVLNADIPIDIKLKSGDMVLADLIDTQHSVFTKRAIKVTPKDSYFGELELLESIFTLDECPSVSLIGKTHLITTQLHKWFYISLNVHNNEKYALHLKSVTVPKVGGCQLTVVVPTEPTDIPIDGEILLVFNVYTKYTGESAEEFSMNFNHFEIRHTIDIIVCKTKEEMINAEKRMIPDHNVPTMSSGRRNLQMCRFKANTVWSRSEEVVPGETISIRRRFVPIRLDNFKVPEQLRRIYLTTERQGAMFRVLEHHYPIIREPPSTDNYVEVFALFLHLEEIENFVLIRNYDKERAQFRKDGEYLSLQMDNLAERRPSLVIGDGVRAIHPSVDSNNQKSKTIYEGIIHKVLHKHILLKFNPGFQKNYNGEEYRLEFHFSRLRFRKQHHAITLVKTRMGDDFLFPTKVTEREQPRLEVRMVDEETMYLYDSELRWYNPSLNPIQKQAVFNIMRGEADNMPYVIFGPPGTGKTMTMVEAILQLAEILPRARILVGTPSNGSADMITRRILESNVLPPSDFVRLVSFNQIDKDLIPPDLMSYCATVDIAAPGSCPDSMVVTESGLKLRCQKEFIGRHRITISTNSTLGNFMQMDFPEDHFTHVFIDEAGQCTEPETMMPISLLNKSSSHVILAGDPRQLQAIVINRYSCYRGSTNSFLERLLDLEPYKKDMDKFPNTSGYNPMCLTKLLNNYRSLPTIMCTFSKLFYDNELIPMVSDTDSREIQLLQRAVKIFQPIYNIPPNQAAFFYGIAGQNIQGDDSPSWYNPQEAKEVFLTAMALLHMNIRFKHIGILTPYSKQVKTIRNLFKTVNLEAPKIGSVEEFQGQERDIMLISLVRSSQSLGHMDSLMSLGFVKSSKRMNVAISRARVMMVVFGNPKILATDESWRRYITYCAQKNALFGCELPDSIVYANDIK